MAQEMKKRHLLDGLPMVASESDMLELAKDDDISDRLVSAFNARQCGTLDTYVCWLFPHTPKDLKFTVVMGDQRATATGFYMRELEATA